MITYERQKDGTLKQVDSPPKRVELVVVGTCHDTEESRWFHCSECGFGITDLYTDGDWYDDEQPKFCPNCGRRVVGRRYLEVDE